MFVYVLITAELALLYTVFWYLYLREPKQARTIVADTWGNYSNTNAAIKNAFRNNAACAQAHSYLEAAPDENRTNTLPIYRELKLDLQTNRYVPVVEEDKNIFARFIDSLDVNLSALNVKP